VPGIPSDVADPSALVNMSFRAKRGTSPGFAFIRWRTLPPHTTLNRATDKTRGVPKGATRLDHSRPVR